MSDTLDVLFGSRTRARILRFFLLNQEGEFSVAEVAKRNMVPFASARKELNDLAKIKFLNLKIKKKVRSYSLNNDYHFYPELKSLMAKANATPQCKSLAKVKAVGDVKLLLVSGLFLNYPKSKADMILVANNINRGKLRTLMNGLEAEVGREISFVLMNSEEFKYRMDMLDRFLLEFLEGPHDEVVNKIPGLKRLIINLKKY